MTKKKDEVQNNARVWKEYIKNPSGIYDKEKKNFNKNLRPERFKFDLHGLTLDDANLKVREILLYCKESKYKEILLITGKGIHSNTDNDIYSSKDLSKLRYSVPDFINSNSDISRYVGSISQADRDEGGEGAIIVKLKKL